ncbi:MAG: hypothetical protein IPM55_09560 [Acidobacteria bacterium]|nr:hypothetical protein [Acidobacteriota bacterium]
MAINRTIHHDVKNYRLFTVAIIVTALIVLIGFARTYYLKTFFGTPSLSSLLHVHGFVMTTWVALFLTQVILVASHRTKIHRKLGVFAAAWAGIVLLVGVMTAISGAARGASPGPPPLVFLVVPLGDMLVFSVLVGCGLYFRRKTDTHKRLMIMSCATLLPASLARIPLEMFLTGGPLIFFGLTDLLMLIIVAWDTYRHRRLHPAFGWGLLFVAASHPLRLLLSGTDLWMKFAQWVTGLV